MNHASGNKESKSIPERKIKYIEHWLEDNSYSNANLNDDFNTKISLSATESDEESKISFVLPLSPKLDKKNLASYTHPASPILSRKRPSTNIQNYKKVPKRIIVAQKLNTDHKKNDSLKLINKEIEKSQTHAEFEHYNQSLDFKSNCDASFKFSNHDNKLNIFNTTKYNNSISKNSLIKNTNKDVFETCSSQGENSSQLIESVSSENESNESTEIIFYETNSDTDKTASDFIEDTSTQTVLGTSFKQNQNSLSQNISNQSISSKATNNIDSDITEVTKNNESEQRIETLISSDRIDSVSSIESRIDLNKASYILQYTIDKQKKKKNPKKGTLSDILQIRMSKERSNVNILRHQLHKKPFSTTIKPFILLQIIQYLPMINENQLLKCVLIEDSMDLLNGLIKKQDHYITVINVPQISCLINTSEKPLLKVYEPWTILDPNQLLLHITRFIAIPNSITEETKIIDSNNVNIKNFKMVQEFYCPCICEKMTSNKCKSKFQDNLYDIIKVIFNYK